MSDIKALLTKMGTKGDLMLVRKKIIMILILLVSKGGEIWVIFYSFLPCHNLYPHVIYSVIKSLYNQKISHIYLLWVVVLNFGMV